MIDSPVFKITEQGISAPTYEEILEYFQTQARNIFGSDINLDADTQDGQLIAIVSAAFNDLNAQSIATYNSFNPQTAVGTALDNVVAVNGLVRKQASYSTADLRIVGQAGTLIGNGFAIDTFERRWNLPESVVIPISGEVTVTATCEEIGAITAEANSINRIGNPTLGWQTVNNPIAANIGDPVETDTALKARQAKSTALPSISLWEGIIASLLNLDGVDRVAGINNDTDSVDDNGIPAHTIAMIIDGGDVDEIGETIFKKKGEGVNTFGDVTSTYIDSYGYSNTISFSRPTLIDVAVTITIKPNANYVSTDGDAIKERIEEYIDSLSIGESVNLIRVISAAVAMGANNMNEKFDVQSLVMGEVGETLTASDIPVAWDEVANCDPENLTVVVTP
jgi:uncharacterized phage protein gp47/JayE